MTRRFHHRIRLRGPGTTKNRLSGTRLRDLLDLLIEGTRGAVRMRVEGRSAAPGPLSSWLTAAADFEVLPLEAGSTVVPIEAAPLADRSPERFAQFNFLEVDPGRSALSLFEESLAQALCGNEEAELFDQALLQRFGGFSRILGDGLEKIEITSEEPGGAEGIAIERESLGRIERLIRDTPPPQRVRIGGQLDTIRHSDRMFTLILATGESLKGVAEGVAEEHLASLFGKNVIVHGLAVFRPSGKVLRVEADEIARADEDLELWSRPPQPLLGAIEPRSLVADQGPRSGLNAIYGRWPGDESAEELTAALEEIS